MIIFRRVNIESLALRMVRNLVQFLPENVAMYKSENYCRRVSKDGLLW